MPSTKRLVCLANSRTLHGRCVWRAASGAWREPAAGFGPSVRAPVERYPSTSASTKTAATRGSLDVIDVPLLEARPGDYQTENWLLDPGSYWEKVGRLSTFDLPALADPVAPLWIDGHSTYNGLNDKIPIAAIGSVTGSLRLLHSDQLQLTVCRPGEAFGNNKRRVQGRFRHAGREYALWVTDPDWERTYLVKLDGTYLIGECFLTISLGEAYGGRVLQADRRDHPRHLMRRSCLPPGAPC